jgi:hypothetical protein
MNRCLITSALVAAAIAFPWLLKHRATAPLRRLEPNLSEQARLLSFLAGENKRLSNTLAQASKDQLSAAEVAELARLRNEARRLRETLKEAEKLQSESRRIRQALQRPSGEDEPENPTALLADVMEVQQKRVAELRQWLDQNPHEKIPELQYISEMSWIRSADRTRVTDEDFQVWVSAQRGNAEARFARLAYEAVKAFGKANDGQFPTDLSQLKPFFTAAVDDAILDRYHIVSARTLPKFLAEAGGEWVITQKAPINPKFDSRLAISQKNRRATLEEGRWDSTPE